MKTRSIRLGLVLIGVGIFFSASLLHAQSVSVSASPALITNEGEESTIALTISPPSPRELSVNFALTGTAAIGSDYVLVGEFRAFHQVVVPADQSTVTVILHTLDDDDGRFFEFAVFNILGGRRYRVGSPSHARVTIENVP